MSVCGDLNEHLDLWFLEECSDWPHERPQNGQSIIFRKNPEPPVVTLDVRRRNDPRAGSLNGVIGRDRLK